MLTMVGRFPRLRLNLGGGTARGEAHETALPSCFFRPSEPSPKAPRRSPPQSVKILVLGAGILGTATAWYAARDGHDVTLVDRQPGAALETSFANGGQISASYAEPWANPDAPLKIAKWLGREDAPLLFRLRADWRQWLWGLRFLAECLPSRTRHNTVQCLNLALYSRDSLKELRAATGIRYDHLERGILQFYTDAKEFEHGVAAAALMRQYGCDRVVRTPDECVAVEPALAACRDRL